MQDAFTPLRNYIRTFDRLSFLLAIYYLSRHLEWQIALPAYLRDANPTGKEPMTLGFYLWELLYGQVHGTKTVSHWAEVRDALNLLKQTEEEALRLFDLDENIFSELTRIAHRQFHWQQKVTKPDIARYLRIYGYSGLREAIEAEYGLSVEQLFQGAFAALATFFQHWALAPEFPETSVKVLGYSNRSILDRYSTSFPNLVEASKSHRSLGEDWAYTFHPLRAHPLIELPDGKRICPVPGLLARRFTDGMYFEVGRIPDALSLHLGPAFQAFVGDVIAAANEGEFHVYDEQRYGSAKAPKDTIDWIVQDRSATLFVECKVLRLAHAGRAKLASAPETRREYDKMAKAVGQAYQTLNDALSGQYPHWRDATGTCSPTPLTRM
jgi:hypothetical protein